MMSLRLTTVSTLGGGQAGRLNYSLILVCTFFGLFVSVLVGSSSTSLLLWKKVVIVIEKTNFICSEKVVWK